MKQQAYAILKHIPAMGRSRWIIRHNTCGRVLFVYPWSFAGYGKKRCPGCNQWIPYFGYQEALVDVI